MKKILLIDGHSILNRAFYGVPELTNSEGLHTNAILGFLNIIFRVIDVENPTHICVAFDVKQPTFRHEMYAEYKGTRKPMLPELREQVPVIKDVLRAMNITIMEKGGYEADDILGTISRIADAKGFETAILSGDRDLLQLATDTVVIKVPTTSKGTTTIKDYRPADVVEKYGVTPLQFIDMKGLMGDSSDNIPGVSGVGEKTAAKLLVEYGTLENILANVPNMKPSKLRERLENEGNMAIFSKELATIKLDCELDFEIENTLINNMFNPESFKIFSRLELKSWLKRFDDIDMEALADFKPQVEVVDVMPNFSGASSLGVHVIEDADKTMVGLAIADAENHVYVVRGGFMASALCEDMVALANAGVSLYFLNLKDALKHIPFTEAHTAVHDVGVMAYLLNPLTGSYGYDDLANVYMGVTLQPEKDIIGKKELNMFSMEDEDFLKVFAYKAAVAVAVKDELLKRLHDQEMLSLYTDLELPTVYTLNDMECRGVKVCGEALEEYSKKLSARIDELQSNIIGYAGEEFNINSPKQLGVVLFENMGLDGGKKTKTGYSTSVDVLEKIKYTHPIIPDILEYRQLTKLNSTYAVGLTSYIADDGRIHGTFNQTVTATGRLSSTEPNLQNIPMKLELGRQIRKAFVPEDGFTFVDADYSQIELRVLAHLSGDATMCGSFLSGVDIHTTTASEVFGVAKDEVTSLQRRRAKAVNFGIVYGMSAFGLGEDLGITRKEANAYIDKYFDTYKNVKSYLDDQVETAKETGSVRTMMNRIRPIPELKSSNFMQKSFGERVAMNSPIQGSAADIIKIAMFKVNMALKAANMKSRLILQIHDELLIEAANDEVEEVKEILKREMMNAAKLAVPLEIDMHTGDTWYDAK